jgi:hypothetical protein
LIGKESYKKGNSVNKILSCAAALSLITSLHGMETLRQRYPWPTVKPAVKPDLANTMFSNAQEMKALLNNSLHIIVELGSWLGSSTRFILDHAPRATVIAVDHWRGSTEHHAQGIYSSKLPTLYETFLVNCWNYANRLIPVRQTTLDGLTEIYALGIVPDAVYVDAAHDYDSVMADLEKVYELFPHTFIMGDDWGWPTVRAAVIAFARKYGFKVIANNKKNFWRYERKKA